MGLDVFFRQTPLDQGFLLVTVFHQTHKNQSGDIQMVSLILQCLVCSRTEEFHSEINNGNTYKYIITYTHRKYKMEKKYIEIGILVDS